MSKKKTKTPEVEQPQVQENSCPDYVKELLKNGVAVIMGRSRAELAVKLSAIPSDVNYCTGAVDHYLGSGLFRVQVSLKED